MNRSLCGYRQRGVSLVVTLFILVVLATLGGYMARMSSLQHTGVAMSIQSARVWYSALSGLEWLVDRVLSSGCPAIPTTFSIDGFQVQVSQCDSRAVVEGADNYRVYNVTVRASRGSFGHIDYVQRQVQASFTGT